VNDALLTICPAFDLVATIVVSPFSYR